ncbi:cellulose biosynthesis protein BcsO [Pantoea sp. KPR_PJ]|uniref:cellulose biosynthesis protein BcsO n=1 Tax=Pantoea sp. KPR_PJ TaxID=2738375 RepID=UPI003528E03C
MKSYDDLQRFKEKTQTLDIAFKDMSGQLQESAGNSQWALIRQLANDDASTPFSGSQRIDLPQPQPLRGDEFQPPAASTLMRQSAVAQPAMATRSAMLNSLADSAPATATSVSSLFPPPPETTPSRASQPVMAAGQPVFASAPQPVAPAAGQSVFASAPQPAAPAAGQSVFASASQPVAGQSVFPSALQPVAPAAVPSAFPSAAPATHAASPRRFGGLFRTRHSEPASPPKETLLKPLLEKIALCR